MELTRPEKSVFLENALIDMYSKSGSLLDARRLFDKMEFHSIVSWNSLLFGYADNGFHELALDLFSQMEACGLKPDSRTFVAALMACVPPQEIKGGEDTSKNSDKGYVACLEKTIAIHSQAAAAAAGLDSQIFVGNALVDLYGKCGSLLDARRVFDRMNCHSVVSWTALLLGCVQCGENELAIEVFAAATAKDQEKLEPDAGTYLAALKACVNLADKEEEDEEHTRVNQELLKDDKALGKTSRGRGVKRHCLEKAWSIHALLARNPDAGDLFVHNTLIELYSQCGSLVDARRVFDSMPLHGIVSWNAIVAALFENGESELGLTLLSAMNQEIPPDAQILVSALTASSSFASFQEKGTIQTPALASCCNRRIHALACRWGFDANPIFANCVLDLYARSGDAIAAAQHLFDCSPSPGRICWNSLIAGYSIRGDCQRVLDLFVQMQQQRADPDAITLLELLAACSRSGRIDLGERIFAAMAARYGITPSLQHYSIVADMLARANRASDAVALLDRMPVDADAACWIAVLGSCRKWGNVAAAEIAFQKLLRIDSRDPSAYLLMANTYSHKP